ncbi:hypothetical protein FO519_004341 [Halicephalobus sp. NKZ332]|nr:hypothetical protein FO519_004341 [Halicephalobus sp. NKZ332]
MEGTGNYMTVPAPSLSSDTSSQAGSVPNQSNGLANSEVYIAKVQNTMAVMEDQNLTNDPRYSGLNELKNRLQGKEPLVSANDQSPSTAGKLKKPLDPKYVKQLKAQILAFKHAKAYGNIPTNVLAEATVAVPNVRKKPEHLPSPYELPAECNGVKLPYDIMKLQQMMLMKAAKTAVTHPLPKSIDPTVISKERDQRIATRIMTRIKDLSNLPVSLPSQLRIKAEIELRGLRLINMQAAVRREVLHALKVGSTVEYGLNAHAYRRVKKHTLREARVTERLEKQLKMEQERKRRVRHADFLQSMVQANREFREFHRNNQNKIQRVKKAVVTYHANSEKERKKDEIKNERLRMMKLMQEDEEGYRQLLDEKKDKRLVYLLQQTDEYVESLTGLVKQHQSTEKKRKKQERRDAKIANKNQGKCNEELQVIIRNCTTGELLKPEETPVADEVDAWLETHPGYEVVSRDALSDSEDEEERTTEKPKEEDVDDEFEGLDEETRTKKIIEKARNEEDEYDQRTRKQMESYYATAHRIKEVVAAQHSMLGGGDPTLQLKPYQLKGLEWMVSLYNNNLNGILADEMGLGKTIQTVALITYLMEVKKINGPYLIIVPLSTISNWALELEKWAPHVVTIIYKGDKDTRKRLDIAVKKGAFNVLLTTYDYVLKEKAVLGKIRWKYMIIDEGHRMKNHTCKLTLTLNAYFTAQHRLLLTGTPLQNKLPELWALLNFLLPSIFSSCGNFEQWFNAPFATTGEKVELNQEETMLIIRRLHKVLRPFLLRRLKKEVESQLPEKTEQIIKCDMSPLQRILYQHMQRGLLLDGKREGGRALMNTVVHLRKLCNHPFLFDNIEDECRSFWKRETTGVDLIRVAGKFELLDRILPKLKAGGHRILIFCQMTQLMTIMEDFFNYRGWAYLRLDGSTKPDERGELLKIFNAENSPYFLFMLSTRAGGLGLNLQTADTVIIFDSDWNPHQDMQAQDRAHRIGQKREVRVFRLITVNSVEEKILAAAKFKLNVDEKVIQAGKFDQRSTGAERRQILEEIIRREEENDEDEIPDDESINMIIARGDDEFEHFQKMDQERHIQEVKIGTARLLTDEEIPETLIQSSKNFEESYNNPEKSFVDDTFEGRRSRKKVDYSTDLMSDREWLKSIDDARLGRKRKREGARSDDPMQVHLTQMLETLINYTDSNGRQISIDFMQLPTRKELPEYYEIVNSPIDFFRIRKNMKGGKYMSIEGLSEDVDLLCSNAQRFNREDSEIFQDSKILQAVWNRLKSNPIPIEVEQSSNSPMTTGISSRHWGRLSHFLVEDWFLSAILGVIVALISICVDVSYEYLNYFHVVIYDYALNYDKVLAFIWWTFYMTFFVAAAALVCKYVAKQAVGSGIPEMKVIMNGFMLQNYLTIRTMVAKVIGLVLVLGSGLPVGKEGPFVHIGAIVGVSLTKLTQNLRGNRFISNESREFQNLLSGTAAGIACTFYSPCGAVLYAIESTHKYFAVKHSWRSFLATTCAALVFRYANRLIAPPHIGDTILAYYETYFPNEVFVAEEIPVFILLGILSGLLGASFVYVHRKIIHFRKVNRTYRRIFGKNYNITFTVFVAFVVGVITFPDGFGHWVGGRFNFREVLSDFISNCTMSELNVTHHGCSDDIVYRWSDDPQNHDHRVLPTLFGYLVANYFIVAVCVALAVPASIFVPTFIIGACGGRIVGETMFLLFPEGIRGLAGTQIYPGLYAVVGAAAFTGAVTHSFSIAVIVCEATRQLSGLLPVLVALMAANAVSSFLSPSIYESMIRLKNYPHLPDLPPSRISVHMIKVEQIMIKDFVSIARNTTYKELRDLLIATPHVKSYPLVNDKSERILLGSVGRKYLYFLLTSQLGPDPSLLTKRNSVSASEIHITTRRNSAANLNSVRFNDRNIHGNTLLSTKTSPLAPLLRRQTLPEAVNLSIVDRQIQMQKPIELDDVAIDPAPFQLVLGTSLYKVHTLFSLLSLNHAYVTHKGQLVGVIGLKEIRNVLNEIYVNGTKKYQIPDLTEFRLKLDSQCQELKKHIQTPDELHEDDMILPAVTLSESHPNEKEEIGKIHKLHTK